MRRTKSFHQRHRFLAALMGLTIIITLFSAATPTASAKETSGSCGTNLTWTLDAGTLTIIGYGAMENYPESTMAPWYDYREQITKVVLPEGLTSIGSLAFYECENLMSMKIPDSVNSIGSYAFMKCTGLAFITMSTKVKSIGRSAFESCESLTSIRLPEGLKAIGFRAFYRCASLTNIVIPSSVTELNTSVFAYCESLARAEILAPIKAIPEWTFFGCVGLSSVSLADTVEHVETYAFHDCENLFTVDYQGSRENALRIEEDIAVDCPKFPAYGSITATDALGSASSTITEVTEDATVIHTTTSTQTENVAVGTVVTDTYTETRLESTSTIMNATLENQTGWDELAGVVQSALDEQNQKNTTDVEADNISVTVYLKDETALTQEVLSYYAGKDMELTVRTEDSSSWSVDCSELRVGDVKEDCNLSYVLTTESENIYKELGSAKTYQIKFNSDAEINAKVSIQLAVENARHNAFLYQENGKKLEKLQAVVVDPNGYAHFYLASVSAEMEYFIGIDVPGEATDNIIVPENLAGEFDVDMNYQPIQYVITGQKSSWGMNINQVTWILLGVMTVMFITVGVTVGAFNKRKLKRGYVPDIDEEC